MAERLFAEIAGEAAHRHPGTGVAIIHRVGALRIGDVSVVVAAASAHRAEAFAACSFVIDEVKARAPIWKREYFQDGVVWIEGPDGCGPRALKKADAAPEPGRVATSTRVLYSRRSNRNKDIPGDMVPLPAGWWY
jgi:hypothetical protein